MSEDNKNGREYIFESKRISTAKVTKKLAHYTQNTHGSAQFLAI